MKGHPIVTDVVATLKTFYRDKANLVWVMAFPLFLIFIFGAVFSNTGSSTYTLNVQDQDGSAGSQQFLEALNGTHALNVQMVQPDADASQYITDHSLNCFMIIPPGFGDSLSDPNGSATIEMRVDQASTAAMTEQGIVNAVANDFNLAMANGHHYVVIAPSNIVQNSYGYVDFLIPGVMGLVVMTNSIFYINGIWMQGKTSGLFKKLATTPMTKGQWLTSKIICGLVMMSISIGIIMIAGTLFYGVSISITPVAVAIIIIGTALFSGLGMLLTRFTKTEESSNMALSVITMPMMFLGGTFFPLEQMPSYLRGVAEVMPLTYINNGLRDSMIYGNTGASLVALAVIAVLGIIFFVAGVMISTWKEDGE
jgi:ABC-2 type transport system permease protein